MHVISLTDEELERLTTIVSCNIDLNMIPNMQEHAKRGNVEKVMGISDAIKKDRKLLEKLLGG